MAKIPEYYLGLTVSPTSVGWAVTDKHYRIQKARGKALWGVRLFDEAQTAEDRRAARASRRNIERQKRRLHLLENAFADELAKVDPNFLTRKKESWLWKEDKTTGSKYSLFADSGFTDKAYHAKYPTVYHLRSELIHSKEPHDIRLVYLALHHLMKARGHFFFDMSEGTDPTASFVPQFEGFCNDLSDVYDVDFVGSKKDEYIETLQDKSLRLSEKTKKLRMLLASGKTAEIDPGYVSDLLAGKSVPLSKLFCDETLKDADVKNISLQSGLDEVYDDLCALLGDRTELIVSAQGVYDAAHLAQILGEYAYISDAKVSLYEQNRRDLKTLKAYVRAKYPQEYSHIFNEKSMKKNGDNGGIANYAAYSKYHHESGEFICTQEAFCKFLKTTLPEMKNDAESDPEISRIYRQIEDGTFLPRLRNTDNRVIPYQLQLVELQAILDNAKNYLSFLNNVDADGLTVADKIIKTFCFRVPYYVGPVNPQANNHWAERLPGAEKENLYPWNFDKIVDKNKSAENFINNLIGHCTYTGDPVLPKNSLLYSEFSLLNEINPIRINNELLDVDVKKQMVEDLFYKQSGKVTKAKIIKYLRGKGIMEKEDVLTGIDNDITANVNSLRDFVSILDRTHDNELVESIIRAVVVFSGDKGMLKDWLKKNASCLTETEVQRICRLNYSGWGTLSKTFLTDIYTPAGANDSKNIIEMMRDTCMNLMQLLTQDYEFAKNASEYYEKHHASSMSLNDMLEDMYVAPAARRGIRQALSIVSEITRICGAVPKKIFVEMERENRAEVDKKRTVSRKEQLLKLYRSKDFPAEYKYLLNELLAEDESNLERRRVYLYYSQLGHCAFTGEKINRAAVNSSDFNLEHIYPQSLVRDNGWDNLLLVNTLSNSAKGKKYPIVESVRQKMQPFWAELKKLGLMSVEKYMRLVRSSKLTRRELTAFIERDLTQTRQTTKALTVLLQKQYGDKTKVVFSKASNVAAFVQWANEPEQEKETGLRYIKCVDVNDLYRAKDAYLNIVVGNTYDCKFTEQFFLNIEEEKYSLNKVFEYTTPGAWDADTSLKVVMAYLNRNNILMTRKSFERKGKLFDLQILPAGQGQLARKQGMDVSKYGGYNKRSVTYFIIVEFDKGKKRSRAIQPVYLHLENLYRENPIAYCENILNLVNPAIIRSHIMVGSLLEIDGKRLYLSGRTSNSLIYRHAYPLLMDDIRAQYVKNMRKYVDRCMARRAELPVSKYSGLTTEDNCEFYDWFTRKCDETVYAGLFNSLKEHLVNGKDKFAALSIRKQCSVLLEILKSFLCDAQHTCLKELDGTGTVGVISRSCSLDKCESAFIIDQSVTGVYSERIRVK